MTIEQIKEEIALCINVEEQSGFLYFLENYVVVPHPSRGEVRLKDAIYGWQKKAATTVLKSTMFIWEKRRQVSATTFVVAYFLWRCLFFINQEIVIVSLTQRDSADVLKRIKFMYDRLPRWLQTPKEEDAKTSIQFENKSRIKALPFKEDVLRGQSPSAVLIDEMAYMEPYAENLLASAVPSLGRGLLTKFSKTQIPSQLFLVSTLPLFNPDSNTYFKILMNAKEKEDTEYKIIDVDVSDIPEYQNHQWHKIQFESLGEHRYNVEVLGKLNEFTDNTFIPTDILKKLVHSVPIRMDFLQPEDVTEDGFSINHANFHESKEEFDESFNYIKGLWIWHDPLPMKEYGIAADVAAGVGGDYSAFHVFDLETGEQVAEYRNNKINTEFYKQIILRVAKFYNGAAISIENNSLGYPLCEWFTVTLCYPKFYLHKKSKNNYVPGLPISPGQRGNVVASVVKAMAADPPEIKLNSIRTINELKFFGYNENTGKLAGVGNSPDDLVLALAQFTYLRYNGFFVTVRRSLNYLSDEQIEAVNTKEKNAKKLAWFKDRFQVDEDRDADLLDYLEEGYSISLD